MLTSKSGIGLTKVIIIWLGYPRCSINTMKSITTHGYISINLTSPLAGYCWKVHAESPAWMICYHGYMALDTCVVNLFLFWKVRFQYWWYLISRPTFLAQWNKAHINFFKVVKFVWRWKSGPWNRILPKYHIALGLMTQIIQNRLIQLKSLNTFIPLNWEWTWCLIIPLSKPDASVKGAAHPGWYRTMSLTT